MKKGKLTFFCGKMGAGKSTRALAIAQQNNSVLISEDQWLVTLYPNRVTSLESYIHYSKLMEPLIKELVQSILQTGSNVVLDFPANTLNQRNWFKSIFSEIGCEHNLVYINASDSICLKQIAQRRLEQPNREKTDTKAMFDLMNRYFVEPQMDEGFNIELIIQTEQHL